jgi:hypothetical protein
VLSHSLVIRVVQWASNEVAAALWSQTRGFRSKPDVTNATQVVSGYWSELMRLRSGFPWLLDVPNFKQNDQKTGLLGPQPWGAD